MSEDNLSRWLAVIMVSGFILGAFLLENIGISYVAEGGHPLTKIHLYSYLTMLLVMVCLVRVGVLEFLRPLQQLAKPWWVAILSILAVMGYGFMRFGTSGLAYLIDTLLVPLLLLPLLVRLSLSAREQLLTLLAHLLLLNAAIAIIELMVGQSIIAVEIGGFSVFRSTAFLAHPLNNALITAALTPLLMRYSSIPSVLYVAFAILALFAFGGRSALGIFLLGNVWLALPSMWAFITQGVAYSKLKFAYLQALAYCLVIVVIVMLIVTPIGERIFSKLYLDTSAEARLDVFILLEQLSVSEWLFGASYGLLNDIAFYIGINVVENYLIGWILNFGIFGCIALWLASFIVPVKLVWQQPLANQISLLSFVLISMTNNALTVKTPALMLLVFTLACCYRGPERSVVKRVQ
ncbi:VpsF family polysaccharide biosynthesis protein [Vibrio misgurnus]|uniref:VpsF family polysaccharide biosynthesis protein n=1 Tax=Vibrio TaxID=662 RepID=UPI002417188C|nr:VpsF family polysaccharide biosynthesis protein [Vibrio sp. gvc]